MSAAIEQIVETYVRLKDRRALEDMLLYRHRLAIELNSRADFDVSGPIRQVDEDIAAVKARLAELGGTVLVPLVNWS